MHALKACCAHGVRHMIHRDATDLGCAKPHSSGGGFMCAGAGQVKNTFLAAPRFHLRARDVRGVLRRSAELMPALSARHSSRPVASVARPRSPTRRRTRAMALQISPAYGLVMGVVASSYLVHHLFMAALVSKARKKCVSASLASRVCLDLPPSPLGSAAAERL